MNDEDCMRRCLELARRAEGKTSPNPIVGAVVLARRDSDDESPVDEGEGDDNEGKSAG